MNKTLINIIRQRISVSSELPKLIEKGEFDWLLKPNYDNVNLCYKDNSCIETADMLLDISMLLARIAPNFERLESLATEKGKGNVYHPLRVALSGQNNSPSPIELIKVLGIKESLERINDATFYLYAK